MSKHWTHHNFRRSESVELSGIYGTLDRLQRMKPQSNSIAGGLLVMLSSGAHIGWGFFNSNLSAMSWAKSENSTVISFTIISWFIGAIVGFCAAPIFCDTFIKKTIYLFSNIMVGIGAILLITLPDYLYAVIFGRFFSGIGHGLAYTAVLIHLADNSINHRRGLHGATIYLFIFSGIIIGNVSFTTMDSTRFVGVVSAAITLFSLLHILLLYKESVVTLIEKGHDEEAINVMVSLRSESNDTREIRNDFVEMKAMVTEDAVKTTQIFKDGNLTPLIQMLLLRIAFVMSFNLPLNTIRLSMIHNLSAIENSTYRLLIASVYTIVGLVVLFTIDNGRRPHFLASAGGASLLLIIQGVLFAFVDDIYNSISLALLIIYQIFCGIGLGLTSDVYSSEAFRSIKRPASIAFTSILENVLQIMFVILADNLIRTSISDIIVLLVCGTVIGLITTYFYFTLPETNNMSIRQTRDTFLKIN
ncbi:unnamed protein product [Diamesa serratosioi]